MSFIMSFVESIIASPEAKALIKQMFLDIIEEIRIEEGLKNGKDEQQK